jgi:hypothetical protein
MAAGSGVERGEAIPLQLIRIEQHDDGGFVMTYQLER